MRAPADLTSALGEIERLVDGGAEPDDVLRAVVRVLHERAGFDYVEIAFSEADGLEVGPYAGDPASEPAPFPVTFQGREVAQLRAAPADEETRPFLAQVASLISPHCLVGWDTGGLAWEP